MSRAKAGRERARGCVLESGYDGNVVESRIAKSQLDLYWNTDLTRTMT